MKQVPCVEPTYIIRHCTKSVRHGVLLPRNSARPVAEIFQIMNASSNNSFISVSAERNFSEALTFTKFSARIVVDILTIYFAFVVFTYIYRFTDAVYVLWPLYEFSFDFNSRYMICEDRFYDSAGSCAIVSEARL